MNPALAAASAVAWPVVGALLVALCGERRRNLREGVTLGVAGSLVVLLATRVLPTVWAGGRPRLDLVEVVPGLHLAFAVEPLGMLFALVASTLWIVTSLYAIGYMRGHREKHQTRFYACFALAIAGALGVAFAANVFTLFVFYEAITLATYPLVTHHGTDAARRAGRLYLGILMGTSIAFLLLAMLWTQSVAGTTDFTPGGILDGKLDSSLVPLLLALYIFGAAKAALMPFHRWLPAAMVAPTPVSALLHAVAVVKAGVFTVLKVTVYIFGLDFLRETGASQWAIWVASFTLVAAAVIALTKDNLKARLAYSTISQLAYIVLGAMLATPIAALGAGLHIAMHAMGKITLFFCAGALYVGVHKTEISQLDGIARRMPWTVGAFLVGSLSIIGLPPTGGMWGKWFLAQGAADTGQRWMVAVYMLSSLIAVGYLMPVVVRAALRPTPGGDTPQRRWDEAPLLCVLPAVLTALGCVALFFFAEPLRDLLEGMLR